MRKNSKIQKSRTQPSWLDQPENRKKSIRWFYGLCGFLILIDLVFSLGWHKHAAFSEDLSLHTVETLPAFYGVFGFLGCAVLVYLSKFLSRIGEKNILTREEDYWEK
ncbi:MAG: hypothetical protein ACO3VB_04265 [Opitutales bacterium]|jgi:hypothetical protein|nr:hypothetical protein [Verrucomicrobiota bacterium]